MDPLGHITQAGPPQVSKDVDHHTSNSSPTLSKQEIAPENSATVADSETSSQASLDAALGSLTISESNTDRMFRALQPILEASQAQDGRVDLLVSPAESIWSLLERADALEHEGVREIAPLMAIKSVLDQLLWLQSPFLAPALRIIADRSRDRKFNCLLLISLKLKHYSNMEDTVWTIRTFDFCF
jgi:hypothetical protein